jgi:ribosome-binding protein aMBF1 (putative translation factor)
MDLMEKCSRCFRNSEEVKLFDGIYVNDVVKICEKCSLISGMPIIKRPSSDQLKKSEKPYGVRNRLERMAHLQAHEKQEKSSFDSIKELETKPELEKPEDLVFKLVDNFHWIMQTERRRKGLTPKQLADSVNESESAIKLLEKGVVPNKSLNLIRTLEQFLKVRLIKRDFLDSISEKKAEENKVSNFILQKKNEIIQKEITQVNPAKSKPVPNFSPGQYRARTSGDLDIRNLQRQTDKIEHDFSFSVKSREQVGEEQTDRFGKEDTDYLKRKIAKENKSSTPSIYELMKKKEARDKEISGKDIEIF